MAANSTDTTTEFHPLYAEEIFIVYMYGTEEETAAFERLLEHRENPRVQVEMIVICEEIIRRTLTSMETPCCPGCQFHSNCAVNSIRRPRGLEAKCCSYCHSYRDCLAKFRSEAQPKSSGSDVDPSGSTVSCGSGPLKPARQSLSSGPQTSP